MKKTEKLRLSPRALQQRLDRKLAADDLRIKKSRSVRERLDVGEYWLLNTRLNIVGDRNVDLVELGKEYGVLHEWEEVVED